MYYLIRLLNIYSEAFSSLNSTEWRRDKEDELKSIYKNDVRDLEKLLASCQPANVNETFKTKWNAYGDIDGYKAKLITKGYTQSERVDYKGTFTTLNERLIMGSDGNGDSF